MVCSRLHRRELPVAPRMFSREEREQIRAALVRAAEADSNVTGAAHLGSAAADRLDDWSDIDLALCISSDAALDKVIAEWTARMYDGHGAVAHCDVRRGERRSTAYSSCATRYKWISASGLPTGSGPR